MEIVDCVLAVSKKIYDTVEEVQANKKRCQRLAERIRCLVTPLNELLAQVNMTLILHSYYHYKHICCAQRTF